MTDGYYISALSGALKREYDPILQEMNRLDVGIYKRINKAKNYRSTGAGYYFFGYPMNNRPDKNNGRRNRH